MRQVSGMFHCCFGHVSFSDLGRLWSWGGRGGGTLEANMSKNIKKGATLSKGRTNSASCKWLALIFWTVFRRCVSALIPPKAMYNGFRGGGARFGFSILAAAYSLIIVMSAIPRSKASMIFSPAMSVSMVCFPAEVASGPSSSCVSSWPREVVKVDS